MGIKGLNVYIKKNCYTGITTLYLNELRGKKIAIDISIYLYKYKSEGILYEGLYEMLSLMLEHEVIPIIIFDGVPPAEKKALLNQRQDEKVKAREEYNNLLAEIDNSSDADKSLLKQKLIEVNRKMIKISKENKEQVKKLLNMMGVTYYEAEGEADVVCAYFVNMNLAYAAMSEDMDLFVYGTTRVIRGINLENKQIVMYNMGEILDSLKIKFEDFQLICIMSGTDYNKHNRKSFYNSINLYKKYKKHSTQLSYFDWLCFNRYISNIKLIYRILEIYNIYSISLKNENYFKSEKNNDQLKLFLKEYGYILK